MIVCLEEVQTASEPPPPPPPPISDYFVAIFFVDMP